MHIGSEITGRGRDTYNVHTFKQCSLRLLELLVQLWEGCEALISGKILSASISLKEKSANEVLNNTLLVQ